MATVKFAHEFSIPDRSDGKIRSMLFDDGAISCCALDSAGEEKCCYASPPGMEEEYWAMREHLVAKGYSARQVKEVATERKAPCLVCKSMESLRSYVEGRS